MRPQASEIAKRRGIIFILSAPSGAGKTTLYHGLRKIDPKIKLSVSCTTRARRKGERNGLDYRFISGRQFHAMITRNEFAEWAKVHGNLYGTPRRPLDHCIRGGRDILLDVDVQGARTIKKVYPEAVSIFLLPPSLTELRRRLASRRTEDPEVIRRRLANAQGEMRQIIQYDYYVVNRQVGEAVGVLKSIVEAERFKISRVKEWRIQPLSQRSRHSRDEQRNKDHRAD
jgi:guanylate kinase